MGFSARIVGAVVVLAACSSGSGDNSPIRTAPQGGWSGEGIYACFASDGKLGFGDHAGEPGSNLECTWSSGGTFACQEFSGTWTVEGGKLVVLITQSTPPCTPNPGDEFYCGPRTLAPATLPGC